MKMLLVEDDRATVETIALCLEINRPDVTIISTASGREALEYLRSETFDCVLLDLGLPDMDGLDVLAQMRRSTARTVVVSARRGEDMISRAKELGASQYITKPFSHQSLLTCLGTV